MTSVIMMYRHQTISFYVINLVTLISEMVCKHAKSTVDKNGSKYKTTNMYWNRSLKEYIPTLTPRSKWTRETRNFKIDR